MKMLDLALRVREAVKSGADPSSVLAGVPRDVVARLATTWQLLAHEHQIRPQEAYDQKPIWLLCGGRGAGKTRGVAEDMLDYEQMWGKDFLGVLCSKSLKDVRRVQIEGPSGLRACAERRGLKIDYRKSDASIIMPHGGITLIVSSEVPKDSRGLNSNYVWGDEVAAWGHGTEVVSNLTLGCRHKVPAGRRPTCVFSTTPYPNEVMNLLMLDPKFRKRVSVTRGSMYVNAMNLDEQFAEVLTDLYGGTRIGQQELEGLLLQGAATVSIETIDAFRERHAPDQLADVVVSIDPSIWGKDQKRPGLGSGGKPDGAGIVVVGCSAGLRPHAFVLADESLETAKFSEWAEKAVRTALEWGADRIVAEVNQGGGGIIEAVETAVQTISDELGRTIIMPVVPVWSTGSKQARAEPVGALYEKGRIHHVGTFRALESEAVSWVPGMTSPNILDALVQGVTHLLLADDRIGSIGGYA